MGRLFLLKSNQLPGQKVDFNKRGGDSTQRNNGLSPVSRWTLRQAESLLVFPLDLRVLESGVFVFFCAFCALGPYLGGGFGLVKSSVV